MLCLVAAQAFSVNIFNSRPGRRTRRSARPPHTGPPRALAHRKREYAQQRARAIARAQSPARARLGRRGARGSGALRRRVCGRAPRHRHTHAAAARPSPPRRGATRGIIDALRGRLLVVAPAAADADRDGHREGLQVLLQPRGKPLPGHRPSVGRRRRGANRPRSSRSRRRWRALGRGGKWRRGRLRRGARGWARLSSQRERRQKPRWPAWVETSTAIQKVLQAAHARQARGAGSVAEARRAHSSAEGVSAGRRPPSAFGLLLRC